MIKYTNANGQSKMITKEEMVKIFKRRFRAIKIERKQKRMDEITKGWN